MIYLLKLVACSALFLLVYLLFLQREKMFGFNRVFLLTGLTLPFFIPLMTFDLALSSEPAVITRTEEWIPALTTVAGAVTGTEEATAKTPVNYLLLMYLVISGALFLRFAVNLLSIWRNIRSHEHVPFRDRTLVLMDQPVSPHSFMGYILVNKEAWQAGHIDKEILYHEYLHGKLFHSVDILLVELVQIFCWFNPFLYFYKRIIELNHEYQVDEQVLKHYNDPRKYQLLLLNQAIVPVGRFSHSFNYIHLKKRIRMISVKSNSVLIQLKIALAVIFTGSTVFLFAEKAFAQQVNKASKTVQSVQKANEPVAKTGREEFDQLASKALTRAADGKRYRFTMAEANRLGDLYSQMTEEEKANTKITLMPRTIPLKGSPPSKEDFERFKDSRMYGVWLDEKRIPNHQLNNYKHTDFADFGQSTLYKNAAHYGQYKYHLFLSTHAGYQAYLEEAKKDTSRYIIGYKQDFVREIRATR